MGQLYLQKFVHRDGVTKAEIDGAWGEAFKAMARSGNFGDVEKGVAHQQTYGHVVHVTWEPVYDMDRAFAGAVEAAR
jgi:hypothetical protein